MPSYKNIYEVDTGLGIRESPWGPPNIALRMRVNKIVIIST